MVARDSKRFTFTKSAIEALPTPRKGQRAVYYDDPGRSGRGVRGLCVRVTSTHRTFFVQRKFAGRQERTTLGQFPAVTVDAARARALDTLAGYARGESAATIRRAQLAALKGGLTLGDAWEDYRANRKRKREDADSRSLEHQWSVYLKPWADRTLAELDTEDGHDAARKLVLRIRNRAFSGTDKDGNPRKYGGKQQANRVQRQARAMFNHARKNLRWRPSEKDSAGGNPFEFDQLSEKGRERERTPTRDEARRLMAAFAKLQNRTAGNFFLMLAYTGQRAGTVRRMKYADVDLESGHWRVGVTKTGAVHRMVLPTAALELVKHRQKECKGGAFVFPGRTPDACYSVYKTAWKRVLKLAEVEGLRVHDLRRLSATAEHEAGVLKQIQARLAHKSGAMTRRYVAAEAGLERLMKDATLAAILGNAEG